MESGLEKFRHLNEMNSNEMNLNEMDLCKVICIKSMAERSCFLCCDGMQKRIVFFHIENAMQQPPRFVL